MAGSSQLKRPRTDDADEAGPQSAKQQSKRARVDAGKSLFVRSLPPTATDASLAEFFSEHFPVKNALVVKDSTTKQSRGYGFVVFTDAQDAIDAKEKLHGQKFEGRPINIDVAKARDRTSVNHNEEKEARRSAVKEERRPPKLIIRNLPWSIKKPEQLAALFRSHGKIIYCDLPQKNGKLSGFGFVTMKRSGAERAIDAVNGRVVDGRTLAVDWAVAKQQWNDLQQETPVEKEAAATGLTSPKQDAGKVGTGDVDKPIEGDESDEDLRNFMKNFGDRLEDEEGSEGIVDREASSADESADDDDNSVLSSQAGGTGVTETTSAKQLLTDNSSTLFVRNLPFSTTDTELKEHFESFGPLRYARVVMDRVADRPAGTGFVNFVHVDDAKKCLKGAPRIHTLDASNKRSILQDEAADQVGSYTLDGRVLQISQAVSKEQATKLAADGVAAREGKDKDKRRLYLLSEGTISSASALFSLLTPSEIKMRDDSAAQRKKQVQVNPSLHLSLTRLAVRNIPRNVTSRELKALAREAVVGFARDVKEGRRQALSKEEILRGGHDDRDAEHKRKTKGKGLVKQIKIVFENKEGSKVSEGDGAGRSRGYGFIEYYSHRSALMGLRWLNGHALENTAGKTQRLIVEFSIENAQVVARRNDRQIKSPRGTDMRMSARPHSTATNDQEDGPKHGKKGRSQAKDDLSGKDRDTGTNQDLSKTKPSSNPKHALEQKIIGRKRTMRKKKAIARRA